MFKGDFIIEKHLLRYMKYIKCLSYPLPFYAAQINHHFLNVRISANHDEMDGLSAN